MSTELFDKDGYIMESVWGGTRRWHYNRAVPVRFEDGSAVYAKQGDRWIAEPRQ